MWQLQAIYSVTGVVKAQGTQVDAFLSKKAFFKKGQSSNDNCVLKTLHITKWKTLLCNLMILLGKIPQRSSRTYIVIHDITYKCQNQLLVAHWC